MITPFCLFAQVHVVSLPKATEQLSWMPRRGHPAASVYPAGRGARCRLGGSEGSCSVSELYEVCLLDPSA